MKLLTTMGTRKGYAQMMRKMNYRSTAMARRLIYGPCAKVNRAVLGPRAVSGDHVVEHCGEKAYHIEV